MKKNLIMALLLILSLTISASTFLWTPTSIMRQKKAENELTTYSTYNTNNVEIISSGTKTANITGVSHIGDLFVYDSKAYFSDIFSQNNMYVYNASEVVLDRVDLSYVYIYNTSKVVIRNSNIAQVNIYDNATLAIKESYGIGYLFAYDFAKIDCSNSRISKIYMENSTTLNIYNAYSEVLIAGYFDSNSHASITAENSLFQGIVLDAYSMATLEESYVSYFYMYENSSASTTNTEMDWIYEHDNSTLSSFVLTTIYITLDGNATFYGDDINTPYGGTGLFSGDSFARIKNKLFYLSTTISDNAHVIFENVTLGSVTLSDYARAEFYDSRVNTLTTSMWSQAYAENSDIHSIVFNLFFTGSEYIHNGSINGHYPYDYNELASNPNYTSSVILKNCTHVFHQTTLNTIFVSSGDVTIDSTYFITLIVNGTASANSLDSVLTNVSSYDTATLYIDVSDTNVLNDIYLYNESTALIMSGTVQEIYIHDSAFANLTFIDCNDVYVYNTASLVFYRSNANNVYATTPINSSFVPQSPNIKIHNSTIYNDVVNNGTDYVLIKATWVGSVWSYQNGTTEIMNSSIAGGIHWSANVLSGSVIIDSYMYYTAGGNYWFNSSWTYASNVRNNTYITDSSFSSVLLVDTVYFYGGSAIVAKAVNITTFDTSTVILNGSYISSTGDTISSVSFMISSYDTATIKLHNITILGSGEISMYNQSVFEASNITINSLAHLIFRCKSVSIRNSILENSIKIYETTILNLTNVKVSSGSYSLYGYDVTTIWLYDTTNLYRVYLNQNASLYLYRTHITDIVSAYTSRTIHIFNSTLKYMSGDCSYATLKVIDSVITNYADLYLNFGNAIFDNVSVGTNFYIHNGTLTLNNVTLSNTSGFYDQLVATITQTVFGGTLRLFDNVSVSISNSKFGYVDLYGSSYITIHNATSLIPSSHIETHDFARAIITNATPNYIRTRDSSVITIDLHSVSMNFIRAYDTSQITGTLENSTVNEINVSYNGTAIIDGSGNTNITNVYVYDFGYLELTNADQIGTAYISDNAYYKPRLSGNITLIKSNVWVNGIATLNNKIPSGSFSIFVTGSFVINQLLPFNIYLNETDDLTLNATNILRGITMFDNSKISLNALTVSNEIDAYNNSKVNILSDVHISMDVYFFDSAILNISGTPVDSSIPTLYLFNSTNAWIRNATIISMYVSGNVNVNFLSYENAKAGQLNETITIDYLYVAPYVLTSPLLSVNSSIPHNPTITSVDQAEQYLMITGIFNGYNLNLMLYDAIISRMVLDNVTAGYLNNVSFTSSSPSGIGFVKDFFYSYNLESTFYGNVTLENCTAVKFSTLSSKPITFVNSTINTLVYGYLVNDTNTLTLEYDTNATEILNSGTGYVTYVNVTSTVNILKLGLLGAVDSGHLTIRKAALPYYSSVISTYHRSASSMWSGVNKTQFYDEYDYTKYGITQLDVLVSCSDDNITWTRIDVMAADGTWHTIVNDNFDTNTVTNVQYTFENFTDIFGSLAYRVKVWTNVSDSTGTTQSGYITVSGNYILNLESVDTIYAKNSGVIEVNKAYVNSKVFLQNNATLRVYETGYVRYVLGFDNARIFVNNTVTDFNCPYLENQTTRGIEELSLWEHSTAEIHNSYLDISSISYYLYDKTSLSIHDSTMRHTSAMGLSIDIQGEAFLALRNVSFANLYIEPLRGNVNLSISDADFYYYKSFVTAALVNSTVSDSIIGVIDIYGNGSYLFETVKIENNDVSMYSAGASWIFENMERQFSLWEQVTVRVYYNYEISNLLDVLLMHNEQLYTGNSRVLASNSKLSFDSVTLRNVGVRYSISVTDPVIDYNSINQVVDISGITATCNNTAHDTLDDTEAIQHYYVIYDNSSTEILHGDLTYTSADTWATENISVASFHPGNYIVAAYFTDSDASGQSNAISFTVTHYLTITSPTLEYNDELAYLSLYNIHAYSSYTPIGDVDDSEAISATYQIINNDTGDIVASGNLAWTGSSWEAVNISTISVPAGVYYVRVYIRDTLNNDNTAMSSTFAVSSYFMILGSRVSMMSLILGIVIIVVAAGIPTIILIKVLRKRKVQT